MSNAKVCNEGYCYKISLILVKNLTADLILGTPFITLFYPFSVDQDSIRTKILNKELIFEFAYPLI